MSDRVFPSDNDLRTLTDAVLTEWLNKHTVNTVVIYYISDVLSNTIKDSEIYSLPFGNQKT